MPGPSIQEIQEDMMVGGSYRRSGFNRPEEWEYMGIDPLDGKVIVTWSSYDGRLWGTTKHIAKIGIEIEMVQ